MAGLFGLLDLGANSLLAQTSAAASVGKNTANVNTEGYSRQTVDLASLLGSGGVIAGASIRAEDMILASRERMADNARASAGDLASALGGLEERITGEGDLVGAI